MRTVADVIADLPSPPTAKLPAPPYTGAGKGSARVMLAVESMRTHVTDEGAQLQWGLEHAGYVLHGHDIGPSLTDVPSIISRESPGVVVVQDQREWDGLTADRSRDPRMRFKRIEPLRERSDIFRLTVIKDAQNMPEYHRESAETMGVHGFIHYYAPRIVAHLAPFVRPEHLIRTWHTVDSAAVPPYSPDGRAGCLLSGAVSGAYPLRQRLFREADRLPETTVLRHPGYNRNGCRTPEFLKTLSRFKVALCTASVFGYSLRKLVEATACGCVVVTDLPEDDVLPGGIDGNLIRVWPDVPTQHIARVVAAAIRRYDPERQRHYAGLAAAHYDYRAMGVRLAADIEAARRAYPCT